MKLKMLPFLVATLIAAGCSDEQKWKAQETIYSIWYAGDKPFIKDIEAIEANLSRNPCVGPMAKWERTYFYKRTYGHDYPYSPQDTSIIEIQYRQAGFDKFKAGRRILGLPDGAGLDDRAYDLVFAKYYRKTGALEIEACGPNI